MRKPVLALAALAFLLAAFPSAAPAFDRNGGSGGAATHIGGNPVPLPANSVWHYSQCSLLQEGPDGEMGWLSIPAQSELWEVTVTRKATLQLTDLFFAGDRYEVYVDGVLRFTTSPARRGYLEPVISCFCAEPILDQLTCNRAFYSYRFSHGGTVLKPGVYQINVKNISFAVPSDPVAGFAIRVVPFAQATWE